MIHSNELANQLNGEHIGAIRSIERIIKYNTETSADNTLTWLSDKNFHRFSPAIKGVIITSKKFSINGNYADFTLIKVDNPRIGFKTAIDIIYPLKALPVKIEPTAIIAPSATIGNGCYIGHHVIIEENVRIGNNTSILHNSVIEANTIIGDNCTVGTNTSIGGEGFGYEKDADGKYVQIRHVGNVHIHNNVDIGNNTCIDRAVIGSTILRSNVKVDNLVYVSHGVNIDENTLIIGCAMLGGSTEIGKNVWVAPSSALMNHIKIGDDAYLGLAAVVTRDVAAMDIVAGNPAKVFPKK